jgi:hypothetical protein
MMHRETLCDSATFVFAGLIYMYIGRRWKERIQTKERRYVFA